VAVKPPIPLRGGDEHDAFTGWRKVLVWSRGNLARIKRRFTRRWRRSAKREVEDLAHDESRADIDREVDALPEHCTRECCRRDD
jgi:hypothetical protein